MLDIEDVHRPTPALAGAGLLAVQLGHHLFRIGTALDGVHMIPITGDDVVPARTSRLQHTDGAGLLARIEVEEPPDLALHIRLIAALFKTPREKHLAQQPFLVSGVHENSRLFRSRSRAR